MTRIGVILGSTRLGRNGEAVARGVVDVAADRSDAADLVGSTASSTALST